MKVYLAARFSRREEMRRHAEELLGLGHEVTAQWVVGRAEASHHPDRVSGHTEAYEAIVSVEDLKDVADFAGGVLVKLEHRLKSRTSTAPSSGSA